MKQTIVITHARGMFSYALTTTPEYPGEEKEVKGFERGLTADDTANRVMRQFFEYCQRENRKAQES